MASSTSGAGPSGLAGGIGTSRTTSSAGGGGGGCSGVGSGNVITNNGNGIGPSSGYVGGITPTPPLTFASSATTATPSLVPVSSTTTGRLQSSAQPSSFTQPANARVMQLRASAEHRPGAAGSGGGGTIGQVSPAFASSVLYAQSSLESQSNELGAGGMGGLGLGSGPQTGTAIGQTVVVPQRRVARKQPKAPGKAPRVLFCLSLKNPIRRWCIKVVEWKYPFH